MLTKEDFGFCEDCHCYFDLWKYEDIDNAGHSACKWRYASEEELPGLIVSCHEPHPHCPECGAIVEEHSLDELDNWFHACWFCQQLFPYYELHWENCFGSCNDAGENK